MQPRGFIALISAIIISAVLLVLVLTGSLTGWYSRFNILDAESKDRSSALADACVDTLLLQLTNGESVGGTVSVGTDECEVLTSSSPYKVQAVYNDSYTNLIVAVDPSTLLLTSWQEVPTL
jgi:hypothetical protein